MTTPAQLESWVAALCVELQIDLDEVDIQGLLDVARDAAHSVTRPAAPLATFLIGYAAAQHGGGADAVAEASRKASDLAQTWTEEMPG
ncbi:DUF6457 domain-containing protein [Demequina oxidasica]|uniref:DUF6457 domain-containing protein n=1 Tax=Demequina oxidasica TaxID=676199 RepID=UPI000784B9C4|nr:DUF6457 domain-containing protein [Demequina oxidasica]